MKLLADMGISPKTVTFLNDLGYEAIHLQDQGLHQLPDPDILKKARKDNWVLLTHDLDFGELVAASGEILPSVVILRLRNMHPDQVNYYLHKVVAQHQENLEQAAVISVTEGRIRIGILPIVSQE